MGKFVKSVLIKREFEGDAVTFVARPMDKSTAIQLRKMKIEEIDDPKEPGKKIRVPSEEAIGQLSDAFLKHLDSIAGLRDSDGNALDADVVRGSAYFVGLVNDAAGEWASRSIPEDTPGN